MKAEDSRTVGLAFLALAACVMSAFGAYTAGYQVGYNEAVDVYKQKLTDRYIEFSQARATAGR